MAREPQDHTLTATALVHEAYLRLRRGNGEQWDNRGHFFAAAARAMRRILVDRARRYAAVRHGAGRQRIDFGDVAVVSAVPSSTMVSLDDALSKLEQRDERKAQVVQLRYFGGLTVEETAQAIGISPRTVNAEWSFARAWLVRELGDHEATGSGGA